MGFLTKVFRPCPRHSKDLKFDLPTIAADLVYTGASQSPTVNGFYSNFMTKSGDTSKTSAGSYELIVSLVDTEKSCFKDGSLDGSTDPVTLQWAIKKATPEKPTLSADTLALSTATPSGTISVTRSGNGEVHAVSSDPEKISVEVSGTTLTITAVDTSEDATADITVTVGAGSNYEAYTDTDVVCAVAFTA